MALYSLVPVMTDLVPTLATDKHWRVYINPTFFAGLTEDQGAMVLVHEVWHPLGLDWLRAEAKGVKPETSHLWNIARDCEINDKDALLQRLPPIEVDVLGDKLACKPCSAAELGLPEGLFAEEMYDLLLKRPELAADTVIIIAPGCGACGSAADGQPKPWELPAPDACDTPGQTEARTKLIQSATAQAVIEHASKGIGNVPKGWLRWAKMVLNPKVRWQDELKAAVRGFLTRTSGGFIPSRRKIGRRQMADPRVLPPSRLKLRQRVSAILDTSGSMSDEMLGQSAAEVDGICKALGREVAVTVYHTDAAAYEAQKVTSAEKLVPVGGGGTDMGEGFRAIAEAALLDPGEAPDVVVCITDGYTPWPPKKPVEALCVFVILTDDGTVPGWARPPDCKVIRVNEEA
jgi:predicted metal-dependent peptidase